MNTDAIYSKLKVFGQMIRDVVWPVGFFSKLGRVIGALSIVALMNAAINYGLSKVINRLIEYYDSLVSALTGWAQPFLVEFANWLSRELGIQIHVFEHWDHVFVLLGIYFYRTGTVNYDRGYTKTAIFCFLWGTLVALATSILMGAIPIDSNSYTENFKLGSIFVGGLFLFDIVKQVWNATYIRERAAQYYDHAGWTWKEFFFPNARIVIFFSLGCLMFIATILAFPIVLSSESPILYALGALVLAIAHFRTARGLYEMKELRQEGDTWQMAFKRPHSTGLAIAMFGVIFWVLIFLITSAGLKYYGL